MMKYKKHSKKLKIVIFNVISAILIVLFLFILYCCFENHWWQCSSEEECLIIHKGIDWDTFNIFAFFILYFIIELVNYLFTDLPFLHYAVIQLILDWVL